MPTTIAEASAKMKALTSCRIGEIVLKTSKFDEMREWYIMALGVSPSMEYAPPKGHVKDPKAGTARATDHRLCFITLYSDYPYKETLAIFDIEGLEGDPEAAPGLHHMQFRCPNFSELLRRYEIMRDAGQKPYRMANHGPGISFYWKDPDGNQVEFGAPCFPTEAEANAFRQSEAFKKNPSGHDVDADDLLRRFKAGATEKELLTS